MGRTIFALIISAAVVGCAQNKSLPVAPVATQQQLEQLRATYQKVDPGARVGRVVAVLPADRLVAIGDVPLKDFHLNEPFEIMDSNLQVLTQGQVIAITKDYLHVKYEAPKPNSRNPVPGDIAVHVSSSRMDHPQP